MFDVSSVAKELGDYVDSPEFVDGRIYKDVSESLPNWWVDIIQNPSSGKDIALGNWRKLGSLLPRTLKILEETLAGVYVFRYGGKCKLIYAFLCGGELYLYEGGNPLTIRVPPELELGFNNIPEELLFFYKNIHDGWCFLPAYSLGPLPVEQCFLLEDLEFDSDIELSDSFKSDGLNAEDYVCVFSNGGGGYVSIPMKKDSTGCFVWWTDAQPEFKKDFWKILDMWISIGLEN